MRDRARSERQIQETQKKEERCHYDQGDGSGWAGWARALVAGSLGLMFGVTLLPATAGAESTPGVTSTSITIGATVPLTGPAAPGYDEIAPAMDAVFAYVNAHGGVDGRKINYTYLDDGYNPANTATLTRKLVLQDNIFADVGSLGHADPVGGAGVLERAEGARSCSSSPAATAGAIRSTPTASDGSRPTRSTARSSAPTSRPTSPGRRSATSTRTTSSDRTWSRGSTWRSRRPRSCRARPTTRPRWPVRCPTRWRR